MRRSVGLGGVLAIAMLAGCFGGQNDASDGPEDDSVSASGAIIHRAMPIGAAPVLASPQEWRDEAGSLPVGAWRPIGHRGFEPTIGTHGDAIYVAIYDQWARASLGWVAKSLDGTNWTDVTHREAGARLPAITNDPYLHVGNGGRVFNLHMYGAYGGQCHWLETSDDGGGTWTSYPASCPRGSPINDHPTLWTGPSDDFVYLCGNGQLYTACGVSADGGATWGAFVRIPWSPDPTENPETTATNLGGHTGHGITAPDGSAYIATAGALVNRVPHIARTTDSGASWQAFRIHDGQSYVTSDEDGAISAHDVELASDEAGNLYAFWLDPGRDIIMATSGNRGESWSDPVRVSTPGVETTSFPAVVGGAEGRVALAYYGTTRDVDYPEMTGTDEWTAYLALIHRVNDAVLVGTVPVNATNDPVARGPCEPHRPEPQGRCHNQVGDFIDIEIDADGRPWVIFVDACSGPCTNDPAGRPSNSLALGTLASGPSLFGTALVPLPKWKGHDVRYVLNAVTVDLANSHQPHASRIGGFPVAGDPSSLTLWWNTTSPTDAGLVVYYSSNRRFDAPMGTSGRFDLDPPYTEGPYSVFTLSDAFLGEIVVEVAVRYSAGEGATQEAGTD